MLKFKLGCYNGTIPKNGALLGVSIFWIWSPILLKVLGKSMLRLLPPSMSTRVRLELTTTGSSTSGSFPGSEKFIHWSFLENEIGVSLCFRGRMMADSTAMISRVNSFWALFVRILSSPPKLTLTMLVDFWKPAGVGGSLSSSSLPSFLGSFRLSSKGT